MKKLLLALLLLVPASARAITYQSVRASTATILTPTIQTGTMNMSSGTITNLTDTNLTSQYLTVNSTASFVGVSGSTISYSSATFSNVNVPGTATVGTLSGGSVSGTTGNLSSNLNVGGTLTVVSSSTLRGNVGINGVLLATGAVTLGSAGNSVTISSTAFVGNTTFYPSGSLASIVSDTMTLSGSFKVQNSSTNSCGYVIGSLVGYQKYTSVTSSATTVTNFIPTLLTGAITPKCATDIIRAGVTGCIQGTNPAAGDVAASLFRGSTDLSPDSSHALCVMGDGGVTTQLNVPCAFTLMDTPASAASTTYTLKVRYETGGGTLTWGNNCGQYLLLEDIAQ